MLKPRSLEALHNLPTTYEVAIITPEGSTVIGYTARRTRGALLSFASSNAQLILNALPEGEDPEPRYTRVRGLEFGPVRVAFTGRTEREAATELRR